MTTLSNEPCVGRVSPDGYPTLPMRLNNIATPVIAWMAATLLLGALASALLTWWQADSNLRKAHSAFETHSFEVVERLQNRMRLYEHGLRGARGTVLTAGENGINNRLFEQYSKTRDIDTEFPGARGFGFIRHVSRTQMDDYLQARRADGRPDFAIKTLNGHEGDRFVIEYIEPAERNRAAIGLDIGSEANRRQAAQSALQTGKATITGPITLVQASGDPQKSLLFLLPIYRGGVTPDTLEERESNGFGWSYSPLALSEVLADFDLAQLQYDLTITDMSNPAQPEAVFNSKYAQPLQRAVMSQSVEREVYGRLWRIEMSARPGFVGNLNLLPDRTVLAASLGASLLLAMLVGAIQLGQDRKRKSLIQQAQLATIVENSADAIIGESNDGRVIIWNSAAERLLGYPRSEALGEPLLERMTPVEERRTAAQLVRQVHANAETAPADTTLMTKEGAITPVSITAGAIRGAHGEIIGIARLVRDISERLRAEQKMRDLADSLEQQVKDRTAELETARRDLQTVLDSVPSMIGYWDKNLCNRVANRAYGDWFGVDPAGLSGKHMSTLLGGELFERNRPHIEGALRGEVQQFERTIPRVGGEGDRHSLANYLPDVVDGEVQGFYVIVHDITDVAESRLTVARERERLASIIEGTNVGTWEWNVQTGTITINERWAEIIGYTVAELQPTRIETWTEHSHPDDLPQAQELLERHFRGEDAQYQSVVRMRHREGHWVWVQSRGRVTTRTPEGAPQWMYGTHQDVSPMKEAEEKLQRAVAMLGGVLDAATQQSIIATDPDGIITLFNTGAEKMLGYSAHELVGVSSPAPLHLMEEVEAYGKELTERYGHPVQGFRVFVHEAERLGFETREWTYVRKDGKHLPVQLSVNTIRDTHGNTLGHLGIAQDMTERYRQDSALRHAKAAAETASAAKSMFLANMSHEIRTPMNAVLGVAHLLADTPLNDDQRQLLGKLQIAGRSLLGIINDVLDISKIEAGEMTTESVGFSPADIVSEVAQLFAPQASGKGIALDLQGLDECPAALLGDPTQLRQVLSNLVSNAIKFTQQGSVLLRVERHQAAQTSDDRPWLKFSVADSGAGISEVALKNLFTPFAQADASTTRRFGGTGLGLSIVKRLAHLMGGDVGVTSAEGVGSTFWVTLPFAVPHEDSKPLQATSHQDQLTIFVADDNDIDLKGLVAMCHAFGWRAIPMASGTELVHKVQDLVDAHQPLPDALLVDWQMPGMDGIEALQMLADRLGAVSLPATLVVSAHERGKVASADIHGIVNRILTKPVEPSTLFNAVNASVAALTGQYGHVIGASRLDAMQGHWLQGVRILLVDDSDINLEVARRLLEKEGAWVETCMNGQEALQALTTTQSPGATLFDAVLMDVQMPVMDGYEATARIRKDLGLADLPIIALTAGALSEERRRAEAAGMNAFLTKPLDPSLLVRTVHTHVGKAQGTPPMAAGSVSPHPQTVGTQWPEIQGIDTAYATKLLQGDSHLFLELMRRMVHDHCSAGFLLSDGYTPEAFSTLLARVHKLRGSAGMLGARAINALTADLETQLRDLQSDWHPGATVPPGLMGLLQALNVALGQLQADFESVLATRNKAIKPAPTTEVSTQTPTTSGLSEASLQRIYVFLQLLNRQDLAALTEMETLAPELTQWMGREAINALHQAVNRLEFAEASRMLSGVIPSTFDPRKFDGHS